MPHTSDAAALAAHLALSALPPTIASEISILRLPGAAIPQQRDHPTPVAVP